MRYTAPMNRKSVAILLTAMLLALFFPAFAAKGEAVNAYVIPVSSPVYGYMDDLYSLCGMARPSTNRPWSAAEAMMILERTDKASLAGTALKLYEKIDGILSEGLRWSFGSDFQMDRTVGLKYFRSPFPGKLFRIVNHERAFRYHFSGMRDIT